MQGKMEELKEYVCEKSEAQAEWFWSNQEKTVLPDGSNAVCDPLRKSCW